MQDASDWLRRTRLEAQQCADAHGEKSVLNEKERRLAEIYGSLPEGDALIERAVELSEFVAHTTGMNSKSVQKGSRTDIIYILVLFKLRKTS